MKGYNRYVCQRKDAVEKFKDVLHSTGCLLYLYLLYSCMLVVI